LEAKLVEFEAEVGDQWPLMQAALGLFVKAAIEANTEIDANEKAHAGAVADSLVQWAQPALIVDRARGRQAVAELAATARALDLPTLADARALPMEPALEKAGVALAGLKRIAKIYDLDLDAALDGLRADLVSTDGDHAVVKVSYPLLGREHSFDIEML